MNFSTSCVKFLTVFALAAASTRAQCTTEWTGGHRLVGVDWLVHAVVEWDPDGAGPATPLWVAGGRFRFAGDQHVSNLAAFDPVTDTWSDLGGGVRAGLAGGPEGEVYALAVLPNGDLVVGGDFSLAGNVAVSNLARWNGSTWSPLGPGANWIVFALAVLPSGTLVAGGYFTRNGSLPTWGIAAWNGTTWAPFGAGLYGGVHALAVTAGGQLIAGGLFTPISLPPFFLARWNGTVWQPLGPLNGPVQALLVRRNGDLVVGGDFTVAGGVAAQRVASWDGFAWRALGAGFDYQVLALAERTNGTIVAGGAFYASGATVVSGLARFDGTNWIAEGPRSVTGVMALRPTRTGLLAGGNFQVIAGTRSRNFAHWDGKSWGLPSRGTDGQVTAMAPLPNGDVVAGGSFSQIAGVPAAGIARWTGSTWLPYGSGLGEVTAVATLGNGDVVAAARPSTMPPLVDVLQRWNGTAWIPFGTVQGGVTSVVRLPDDSLVIGGGFGSVQGVAATNIARWDGTAWSSLGGGVDALVLALAVMPDGSLVAGGTFFMAGGNFARNLARWDGAAWSALGAGIAGPMTIVHGLAAHANGTLDVAGMFLSAGGLPAVGFARWHGGTWSAPTDPLAVGVGVLPPIGVRVAALPGGDSIVAGAFTVAGSVPAARIVRTDGTRWSALGGGLAANVLAMCFDRHGDLLVAGEMVAADGKPASHFVRLAPTCAPRVQLAGAGCAGSGGANTLAATSMPWIGATCRSVAAGMPSNGLAVVVSSFTASATPLAAVHPLGGAGCQLLVAPDLLTLAVPSGGSLAVAFDVPPVPAFVGATLRQQVVALDFGSGASLQALTSTNALALRLGVF